MKTLKYTIMALAATALIGGTANASLLSITNASFEYPALSQWAVADFSTYASDSSFGWTNELPYVVYQPRVSRQATGETAQDGSQDALIVGTSLFRQNLSATWAANTTYTLTAWMIKGQSPSSNGMIGLGYGTSSMTTANSMTLSNVVADSGDVPDTSSWVQTTVTFTTGASDAFLGQNIVVFGQNRTVDGGNNMIFDNFQLDATAVVPEPATVAMLMGGFGMLAIFRRRRS